MLITSQAMDTSPTGIGNGGVGNLTYIVSLDMKGCIWKYTLSYPKELYIRH